MSEFIYSGKPAKGKTAEIRETIQADPEIPGKFKGLYITDKQYPLEIPYNYRPMSQWERDFYKNKFPLLDDIMNKNIYIELELEDEEKTTKSANKKY